MKDNNLLTEEEEKELAELGLGVYYTDGGMVYMPLYILKDPVKLQESLEQFKSFDDELAYDSFRWALSASIYDSLNKILDGLVKSKTKS